MLLKSKLLSGRPHLAPAAPGRQFVNVPRGTPVFSCKRFAMLSKEDLAELERLRTDPYAAPERGSTGWLWVGKTLVPCFYRHAGSSALWQRVRLPSDAAAA